MAMVLQQTLRGLCCKGGWCYAVFWKLKRRNRMVLTWEDGYYEYSTPSTIPSVQLPGNATGGNPLNRGLCGEDQIGLAVAKMSYHVYSLGEGIIGRVAFTQKHQWVFGSTNRNSEGSAVGKSSSRSVVEKYPAGWTNQFAAGIKTIAVISVAQGVVQLGSVQTIMEDLNLVAQIRAMFSTLQSVPGAFLSDYVPDSQSGKPPTSQPYTLPVIVPTPAAYSSQVGMGIATSGIPRIGKFATAMASTYAVPHSLSAFDLVMQNRTSQQPQENKVSNIVYMTSPSTPTVCSTAFPGALPSSNLWEFNRLGPHETGTTAGQSLHTGLYEKPLHDIYESGRVNNVYRLPQGLDVTQNQPACLGTVQLVGAEKSRFEDAVQLGPSISEGAPVLRSTALDSGFQTSCLDMVNGSGIELASDLSSSYQDILRNGSSSWTAQVVGDDFHALGSLDSSTLAPRSEFEECRGWDISEVLMPIKADKGNDRNGDVDCFFALLPKDSGTLFNSSSTRANLPTGDGSLEVMPSIYIKDQENGSNSKELYPPLIPEAALAIENLPRDVESAIALASDGSHLEGVVVAAKSEQDPDLSSARSAANPVELASNIENVLSECANSRKVLPTGNPSLYKVESNQSRAHALSHGWVGKNLKNQVEELALPKKQEEIKAGRKRARPGETGRPRPKDRQQIQDRVKELREIVPNAEKCSIDTLLEKTIKHLHFLQSVMQHSGKWNEINEPKENSNKVWKEIKLENGASWALELDGNGPDRCPIIVENLGQPGQMLVEMLCEEKGLFLEIAANIRSLGLVILKGMMETRNDKIWARFVVESSRDVHRFDVVWSLTRLLQPNFLGEVARQGIPTADDWV